MENAPPELKRQPLRRAKKKSIALLKQITRKGHRRANPGLSQEVSGQLPLPASLPAACSSPGRSVAKKS